MAKNFVDALVKDPSNVPSCMIVVGFPGKGSSDLVIRIYQNAELDSHLEFAKADVLHSEPIDTTKLSPTIFWVRREAEAKATQTCKSSVQANFLRGQISSNLMGVAAPSGFGAIHWISWTWTVATTLACLTAKVSCICPTGGNCPSASGTSATSCCLCT